MTKGYMVEARLTKLGDRDHIVTGYYAVAKDTEAEAEDTLVRFLSGPNGGKDSGISAHAVRPLDGREAAKLNPDQIQQRG